MIVLQGYYRKLADEIAEDILDHADDFDSSSSFGKAETLLERHSRGLCSLSQVFGHLSRFTPKKKPPCTEPLGKDEFRCFGCGGVIKHDNGACMTCGWTWR